jgi:hypothetical protein
MPSGTKTMEHLVARLQSLCNPHAASLIYYQVLFQLFKARGDELDEERIVKSATGIKNTAVWKRLFKFQRDGVVGISRSWSVLAAASSRTVSAWKDIRGTGDHQVLRTAQ